MSKPVISIRNLGKRYKIGGPTTRYKTLRESIMNATRAPFNRLRGLTNSNIASRHACPACPACPVAPEDGTGVAPEDGTGVGPEDRTGAPGASNLSSQDDTIWALRDVSFEVQQGDVVGIIGPNGAGKTTLLKILSRITRPTEGEVDLKGRVGSLLEVGTGFHPELTGRENIYLNGAILGMGKAEINRKFDEIVSFAEIEKFLDTPVKRYSTGMGTRLAFAVAAHLDPEILLVDEVLAVGDLAFQKKCLGKMENVSKEGRTVLFVSHYMNTIRRLCNNGILLEKGRVKAAGNVYNVVSQYESSVLNSNGPKQSYVERDKSIRFIQKYFSRVFLTSIDGEPKRTFRFGDVIQVNVAMEGASAHSTHFFEWFINDIDRGTRVAWGGSQATQDGDIPGNCKELTINVGPLTLTNGRYSISINMGVGGVALFDFWHDAISFEIIGCDPLQIGYDFSNQYAPVFLPYTISRR